MLRLVVLMTVIFFLLSCGRKTQSNEDILLQYGDNVLTLSEVNEMIPKGISASDSASLFNTIVDGWLKEEVLSDFAEERLYDKSLIDRKVREYRNKLIVQEYLSRMQESQNPKIDENKINEYYQLHSKDMKLEVPLIKGMFIKINNSIENREELKKLLFSEKESDIDELEQKWLDQTLEYNYFRDKWIDWETLNGMIPYRFRNPDTFLKENKNFELEYGDCVYYLQISEYILSGDIQPYEYAKTWISNILTQKALSEYEKDLVNSLLNKAIKENKLKMIGYQIKEKDL